MFNFKIPYILLLIPVITYLFFRKNSNGAIKVPGIQVIKKYSKTNKKHLLGKLFIYLSSLVMIIALARPQTTTESKVVKKEGIDIVISLDLSKSMETVDFIPNRLEKSKEILAQFIDKRPNDR
ncbi:MAG: vWA domain-containing protein, partial [Cetobacterium sp.]